MRLSTWLPWTEPQCRSSGESSTSTPNKEESKHLLKTDGEIGCLKNNVFQAMTNFSVRCMGYVMDDVPSSVANGFLFKVIPKDHIQTEVEGHESDSG